MIRPSMRKSPPQIALVATCLILLLVASTANALERTTKLTQYAHREWRTGDAGLMGTPQGITQSADGYIWVSTQNGLFRFDGSGFAKWLPRAGESLPSSSMWHLFGAQDVPSMWVPIAVWFASVTVMYLLTREAPAGRGRLLRIAAAAYGWE